MKLLVILLIFILAGLLYAALYPVREFYKIPVYTGDTNSSYSLPPYNQEKKNIFVIAYNKGTEIFDLIAPFYLFKCTNQANVFIIAPEKKPIAVMKGFFVLPHYTFDEVDALQMEAAAIIIPNLSAVDKKMQDQAVIKWIREKKLPSTSVLSVCAGSFTAASTGLYDGKSMTTHASEMSMNKKLFDDPIWVDSVTFTQSGNLYSTAGVSNAVEGSLAVIRDLFGEESMKIVMASIHYPHPTLKENHRSLPVSTTNKIDIIRKVLFHSNKDIGVLLQDNMDEFTLAAVLDAYHRTFPASLKTYTINKNSITSKFGLTILPTGNNVNIKKLDELHIIQPGSLKKSEENTLAPLQLIKYDSNHEEYIFDVCLKRIGKQYGAQLQTVVKRLLDYN